MTPYSSVLAWKIPWIGDPGRLQSKGSLGWDDTANENAEGSRSGSVTGESLAQPRGHSWGLHCRQLNLGTGLAGQP